MASVLGSGTEAPSKNSSPAASPATGSGSTTAVRMKKRRMRFSSTFDILLLKAVTAVDAHLAPHGESQKRFDEALGLFTASLPAAALQVMCQPS